MTQKDDDKALTEGDHESKSAPNPGTQPVSTRVGRNSVEIDVPALKHLVETVKSKLKP